MSEQWRKFRNQKTGCISEPYFFECVPLKEAGKKMRINKEAKSFGMSWEKEYGYSQAVKVDNTIYVSGQVSHDDKGNIVGL